MILEHLDPFQGKIFVLTRVYKEVKMYYLFYTDPDLDQFDGTQDHHHHNVNVPVLQYYEDREVARHHLV